MRGLRLPGRGYPQFLAAGQVGLTMVAKVALRSQLFDRPPRICFNSGFPGAREGLALTLEPWQGFGFAGVLAKALAFRLWLLAVRVQGLGSSSLCSGGVGLLLATPVPYFLSRY